MRDKPVNKPAGNVVNLLPFKYTLRISVKPLNNPAGTDSSRL